MRKAISGVGQLIGVLVAVIGLIVCMCDTADLDKQILIMFAGLVIFLAGAGIVAIAKRGEKDAVHS